MKMHKSITVEVLEAAVHARMTTLDNPGFCVACGAERHDVEPDARGYYCETCGRRGVYGADELLLMVAL